MIATRVVAKPGLQLVNKLEFAHVGGVDRRNGYLFHVGFYQSPPVTETEISNIQVFKPVINGGELPDGNIPRLRENSPLALYESLWL
jgi:hypothetical protein